MAKIFRIFPGLGIVCCGARIGETPRREASSRNAHFGEFLTEIPERHISSTASSASPVIRL
jgi:hypothetical protein